MLLQSLRSLWKAPGRPGSIWKYLEALVRPHGVSGRFACGFRTDLYFADVVLKAHRVDKHYAPRPPLYPFDYGFVVPSRQ